LRINQGFVIISNQVVLYLLLQ